jgi:hypothetical protein
VDPSAGLRARTELVRHCCVGRKSDTTPAPCEALRVRKYTTGVYSTLDKSPIRRLAAARKFPRRRNATVPSRLTSKGTVALSGRDARISALCVVSG